MCTDCGCARPDDDGPDHEGIPGGLAEAAVARSQGAVAAYRNRWGGPLTYDADDAIAPVQAPSRTHMNAPAAAQKED